MQEHVRVRYTRTGKAIDTGAIKIEKGKEGRNKY